MLKYLVKPIRWCLWFFIGFPLLFVIFSIGYIFVFLWDFKLGIKIMKDRPYSYQDGDEWDEIKYYTTGWHWLLGLPHYKEEEGQMLYYFRKKGFVE